MNEAARDIDGFVGKKSFEDYIRDKQLRMAVERAFEIIGEALSQLHKCDASTAERITNWQAIVAFRNVLIHGYAQVNPERTWDVVQTELPTLRRELSQLIDQ
ncbi:MAG TPA: DUF86 domain-containing protein [Tepidisphaeraceae bacterium]|nr:DUF86 domain-containing protein [Tepidisphaeraceae bacterium]